MSIEKISVFISSRFEEFRDLRKALVNELNAVPYAAIHAIDLDDNGVDSDSPAAISVDWIKRSELMILLVGDSYGPPVQNSTRSHTHLEYLAALEEDSETRVNVAKMHSIVKLSPMRQRRIGCPMRCILGWTARPVGREFGSPDSGRLALSTR